MTTVVALEVAPTSAPESPETPVPAVVNVVQHAPTWLHRIQGAAVILLGLALLAVVGVAAFFGQRIIVRQDRHDQTLERVVANLKVMNEQAVTSEIIKEKLPNLDSEQQARVAFELYDGARRHGIPLPLLFGLIEKESAWNYKVVSSAGAVGLMQLMPGTAITHCRAKGIPFSMDKLNDPVISVSLGIQELVDRYEGSVAAGRSPKNDWTRALYLYNGGGESYARQVIELSTPYQKRFESPLAEKIAKS